MDEQSNAEESSIANHSMGLEHAMDHLKSTLHEMKLQDAIHRQEIRKLEKENDKHENKISELKETIKNHEKQKSTDEQYLLKQQEIIINLEIAEKLDRDNGTSGSKNKVLNTGKHQSRLSLSLSFMMCD
jgi:chromosome segregation ATPase